MTNAVLSSECSVFDLLWKICTRPLPLPPLYCVHACTQRITRTRTRPRIFSGLTHARVKQSPRRSTGRMHSTCSPAPATRPRTAARSRRRGPTSAAAPAWTASSGTAPVHVQLSVAAATADGRVELAPVHSLASQAEKLARIAHARWNDETPGASQRQGPVSTIRPCF